MGSRIRIDDDAAEKLENAAEEIDASKTGLASELIRKGAKDILE
jgi:predicted transcriptional regulator